MGWLSSGWDGEEDLWKLAWIYGALFIFLGHVLCVIVRLFTDISIDSPSSGAGILVTVIEAAYYVWLMVSLWRCAFNAGWSGWGYLTRFAVIICAVPLCALSYEGRRLVLPEEVIAQAGPLFQSQIVDRLNPPPPVQKKKPVFMIKVKRI